MVCNGLCLSIWLPHPAESYILTFSLSPCLWAPINQPCLSTSTPGTKLSLFTGFHRNYSQGAFNPQELLESCLGWKSKFTAFPTFNLSSFPLLLLSVQTLVSEPFTCSKAPWRFISYYTLTRMLSSQVLLPKKNLS